MNCGLFSYRMSPVQSAGQLTEACGTRMANVSAMDLAGLHALLHQPVVVQVSIGTKFIGRLETIANSSSTVTLVPLDAATAEKNDYAVNGVAALDIGSIVFIQHLPQ